MNMNWSRPPPPNGAPPSYALATKRNLRPVVMFCASMSALWALFSAIGNFRSISAANDGGFKSLVTFAIVMGVLHIAVLICECFGIFAAFSQRLPLIRTYAFLSGITTIIVVAVGLLRVIMHFTAKDNIIAECTDFSTDRDIYYYPFGFWGPVSHDTINADDARKWCQDRWSHDSWADIVALLITMVLAGMFTVLAWSWYRQALDPNNQRVAPKAVPAVPGHYNPPYSYTANVPNMPYGGDPFAPSYAPPPGPPPQFAQPRGSDDGKPPGYANDGYTGYSVDAKDLKDDDPFADYAEGARRNDRDITSPRP